MGDKSNVPVIFKDLIEKFNSMPGAELILSSPALFTHIKSARGNEHNLLLNDYITKSDVQRSKTMFAASPDTKYIIYKSTTVDFWELPNVVVVSLPMFTMKLFYELHNVKNQASSDIVPVSERLKDVSIFVGDRHDLERNTLVKLLAYQKLLSNANYSCIGTSNSYFSSDKHTIMNQEFQEFQETFNNQLINYTPGPTGSKVHHAKNFNTMMNLIQETKFYVAQENNFFESYEHLNEKAFYGYYMMTPSFPVMHKSVYSFIIDTLGFKPYPMMDLIDTEQFDHFDDYLFCLFNSIKQFILWDDAEWEQYYKSVQDIILYNFNNIDNAQRIMQQQFDDFTNG